MLTHEPGGTSSSNIIQWMQCYRRGYLKRYDYGSTKNKQYYGTEEPQSYCLKHLEHLPFNSYLFRGTKDAVSGQGSFKKMVNKFDEKKVRTYELDDYHHLEYLWSSTACHDVYADIVHIADECSLT